MVGLRLVPLLIEAGHAVVGMTRSSERARLLERLGARTVICDAFDRRGVLRAVAAESPEFVMHQLTDLGELSSDANARLRQAGTRNLIDAARIAGVRRVVAQSISWAYIPGDAPAREDEPLDLDAAMPRQVTIGGVHALEEAVTELPEGVVLRYGALYGPGTWYGPGGSIWQQVMRRELQATGALTSFLHVDDAARAAMLALEWPAGLVNIVDDEPAPASEWVPAYAAVIGGPEPPRGEGDSRTARGASNTKARQELGWEPLHPTWRQGFQRALGAG